MSADGISRAFIVAGFANVSVVSRLESTGLAYCVTGKFNIIVIRHGMSEAKQGVQHLRGRFDHSLRDFPVSV
jgi:hypothetical protein